MDAIKWLEAGFEATLRELRSELTKLEVEYGETWVTPRDLTQGTDYLRRFQPIGYVRSGSVFFSIKEDNEIGVFINRQ